MNKETRTLVLSSMNRSKASKIKAKTSQRVDVAGVDLEQKLRSRLEELKQILRMGYELRVKWAPNGNGELSGEVKGDCIYVYEETAEEALSTLRHEFLDNAISNVVEPYKQVTNKLIALINDDAYKRKERLVEKLSMLLHEC